MSLNDALDDSAYIKDTHSMNMQGEQIASAFNGIKDSSPLTPINEQFDGYRTQQLETS